MKNIILILCLSSVAYGQQSTSSLSPTQQQSTRQEIINQQEKNWQETTLKQLTGIYSVSYVNTLNHRGRKNFTFYSDGKVLTQTNETAKIVFHPKSPNAHIAVRFDNPSMGYAIIHPNSTGFKGHHYWPNGVVVFWNATKITRE